MMTVSINQLPLEVLVTIFDHVKHPLMVSCFKQAKPDPTIFSCLLSCKKWHDIALLIIYHDISLHNDNLTSFIRCFFRPTTLTQVRSLTVSANLWDVFSPRESFSQPEIQEQASAMAASLVSATNELPRILAQMMNLGTFSLSMILQREDMVCKDAIASVLSVVPESCVNLELNLRYKLKGAESVHSCETIRNLLPRLNHLRLDMPTICPDIFAPSLAADSPTSKTPIYKSLQTLIINGDRGQIKICEKEGKLRQNAVPTLVKSLRTLFQHGGFPHAKRIWVLERHDGNDMNRAAFDAWNRRDIINNKTWKLPWTNLVGRFHSYDILFTRTPEGDHITFTPMAHAQIGEAQTWKETITGSRLPDAEIQRKKNAVKSAAASLAEYRQIRPKGSCDLWTGEKATGVRLVEAEEREGLDDTSPIIELTPPGWKRFVDEDGMVHGLERDTRP